MVLPVPRGGLGRLSAYRTRRVDGAEDLDVEVFEFEHAVADAFDVIIDEEVGTDIAGVGVIRPSQVQTFHRDRLRNKCAQVVLRHRLELLNQILVRLDHRKYR